MQNSKAGSVSLVHSSIMVAQNLKNPLEYFNLNLKSYSNITLPHLLATCLCVIWFKWLMWKCLTTHLTFSVLCFIKQFINVCLKFPGEWHLSRHKLIAIGRHFDRHLGQFSMFLVRLKICILQFCGTWVIQHGQPELWHPTLRWVNNKQIQVIVPINVGQNTS